MKLPHVAKCDSGVPDEIAVVIDPDDPQVVRLEPSTSGEKFTVFLVPGEARRLAKAIKKAAKRAEAAQ